MEITYNDFIQNILDTRGRFACGDEYHETHHIVPKCLGGSNEEDNLIDLFAREHFIAHKLLAQENPDNKSLVFAWTCMAFPKNREQQRYTLTPEEYEEARKAVSKAMSGRVRSEEEKKKQSINRKGKYTGESNPFYGKCHTKETRKKISEAHKGKNSGENHYMYGKHLSEETRNKISKSRIGKSHSHSEESKTKISEKNKGKKRSEEQRKNMSANRKDKKVVICIDTTVIYESTHEAERQTGINHSNISKSCKTGCTAGGFHWTYYEKYKKREIV